MKQVFELPHQNWDAVKERLDWCAQTFGPRLFGGMWSASLDKGGGGAWTYDAVQHNVVIMGKENILLYQLRWS